VDRALLATLGPGDEAELERFLVAHADSSMFLRANLRRAGIVDRGELLQATYVAVRLAGEIVAVAAHAWNGMVIVQGRVDTVGDAVRAAAERSGRDVNGFSGPYAQVVAARVALGLAARRAALDSREDLFTLALDDLRVPPLLADGRWTCRHHVEEATASSVTTVSCCSTSEARAVSVVLRRDADRLFRADVETLHARGACAFVDHHRLPAAVHEDLHEHPDRQRRGRLLHAEDALGAHLRALLGAFAAQRIHFHLGHVLDPHADA
jgi:hypothetical protein